MLPFVMYLLEEKKVDETESSFFTYFPRKRLRGTLKGHFLQENTQWKKGIQLMVIVPDTYSTNSSYQGIIEEMRF